MHFVVCIKQVPDSRDVTLDLHDHRLIREGVPAIINPFDVYAIEEGLRLKARTGGAVTVISMGPPRVVDALREAIAMGADNGILLSDPVFAGSDTWATSYALSMALRKIGDYTLILCGKQSSDGETGQTGPGIAMHLDLPQITCVRKIEEIAGNSIVAERLLEKGYEVVESTLPCVLTVVKEINQPRFPSLKGKMGARRAVIPIWTAKDIDADPNRIGLNGSPAKVVKTFMPMQRSRGEMIDGDPDEIIKRLVDKLKNAVIEASD